MPDRVGCSELVKVFMDGCIIIRAQGDNEFVIEFPRQPKVQLIAHATDMAMALTMLASNRYSKGEQEIHETEPLSRDSCLVSEEFTPTNLN